MKLDYIIPEIIIKDEIPLSKRKFVKKCELGYGYKRPENYQRFKRNEACPCGSKVKYKNCHWKVWN